MKNKIIDASRQPDLNKLISNLSVLQEAYKYTQLAKDPIKCVDNLKAAQKEMAKLH